MKRPLFVFTLAILLAACGNHGSDSKGKTSTTGSSELPAECETYISAVTACMKKNTNDANALGAFQEQMDRARAEWAKVPDKSKLVPACEKMNEFFQKATASLKC